MVSHDKKREKREGRNEEVGGVREDEEEGGEEVRREDI